MKDLKDIPIDVVNIIMNKLGSEELKQVSELNTNYHERYSNLFFATRCLERNSGLRNNVEMVKEGDTVSIHFPDETDRETEALDLTNLRPTFKL